MMKTIGKLSLVTILAAVVLGVPMGVRADDKTPPVPAAPTAPEVKKPKAAPFKGKLLAVDLVNKTITLDEKTKRTFEITSDTKITKAGKPATLGDAVVGEDVGGRWKETTDGKLEATSVRFGPKAVVPKEAPPAK